MSEKDPFSFEDEDDDAKKLEDVVKERNRLGKALRDQNKELEDLRVIKAEAEKDKREQAVASMFGAVGLSPAQAKLYLAVNPETDPASVTEEAVTAFAEEHGLVVGGGKTAKEAEPKGEAEGEGGFKPVSSPQAQGSSGVLTREEWLKLAGSDPQAAEAAFKANRVDLSGIRTGLGPEK